uniref:Uncharacterized protein n=1 Tax=Triticum urartu TaxID=4572 RepID=A0A8R7QCX0_TRIUA
MGRAVVVPKEKENWQLVVVFAARHRLSRRHRTVRRPHRRRRWVTHRRLPRPPPLPASSWPPGPSRSRRWTTCARTSPRSPRSRGPRGAPYPAPFSL